MQLRHVVFTLLAAIIALTVSSTAVAKTSSLSGEWVYAGGKAETKARMKSIESATSELSFLIRGKAREKLTEGTKPKPTLQLAATEDAFEVRGAGGKNLTLRYGAKPVDVSADGKTSEVSARKRGDAIEVTAKGESGTRTSTYLLSPDGATLTISVRMTGDKMEDLAYQLTYRRK